jgi:DNA polymerase I-like protein with 3'-5' exonuclease and polymerase domains
VTVVTLDIETTGKNPLTDRLLCVGIGDRVYPAEQGRAMARALMLRRGTTIAAHTNFDLRWLMIEGARLGDGVSYHDTKVLAWMLDGTQDLDLESLCKKYCGYVPDKRIRQMGGRPYFRRDNGEYVLMEDAPWDELSAYNRSDLAAERALYDVLKAELVRTGQWRQFLTEEAPFSKLLVEIEATGMPFDVEAAREKQEVNGCEQESLRRKLVAFTDLPDFNPGSADQVARFLYTDIWKAEVKFAIPRLVKMSKEEKLAVVQQVAPAGTRVTRVGRDYAYGEKWLDGMGLRPPKRDKKQKTARPSVNSKKLTVLHGTNPWVVNYLDWRRHEKMAGYLRDWIARAHEGQLYARFDQSGTATGRLAGREPNLQQVATEGPYRALFRGPLVIGDYAGLEARLAAHFSGDPVMVEVFTSGADLYGTLAARAWGGEPVKENPRRGLMKVVWLATQYGAGAEQLAFQIALAGMEGYGVEDARRLLDDFEATLPRLFEWKREVIAAAEKDGYVTTLGGRRRKLSDINSADWKRKGTAERQAVSTRVQGTAADVVRRAMLAARKAVDPRVARICLQVHDEVAWVRGPEWQDECLSQIVAVCEDAHGFDLDVPLIFEACIAESWADKGGPSISPVAYESLEELVA